MTVLIPAAIKLDNFLWWVKRREGGREAGREGGRGKERSFDFYEGRLNETMVSRLRKIRNEKEMGGGGVADGKGWVLEWRGRTYLEELGTWQRHDGGRRRIPGHPGNKVIRLLLLL